MKRSRGFTLVEILVAVMITSILSIMAFEAMQQALTNRERVRAQADRLRAVQFAIRTLVQDFSQVSPRAIREPVGEGFQPALLARTTDATEVSLTRGGWMNAAGTQRSSLQRVRYSVRDAVLTRDYWLVLDAQLDPAPVSRELLTGVQAFRVRFMNDGHAWQEGWPPPPISGTQDERWLRWRPIAVEVTIELEDWGRITRIIEVAG